MIPFINYWDYAISDWLSYTIDPEQAAYGSLLNPDYLPEPYWGDPDNCSFVIVNYNPGGGNNLDPHTYRTCANSCCSIPSLIKYVKNQGYSKAALDFPLLQSSAALINKGWNWFLNYGGYIWWQRKRDWIKHLASVAKVPTIDDGLMPFALELCPWHSPKWPGPSLLIKDPLIKVIRQRVINVMHYAICRSKGKFAVCIGKDFTDILPQFRFIPCSKAIRPISEVDRFYQLFRHKVTDLPVLVTWANGSNRHPSSKFYAFEGTMISNIQNHITTIL